MVLQRPARKHLGQGFDCGPSGNHLHPVDEHRVDSGGELVRILVGGAVGNGIRIEEDEVGVVALGDAAPPGKPEAFSGAATQLVNRLLQRE